MISSDNEDILLNTGAITDASSCACNDRMTCSCSFIYMGDSPGQTINLPTGQGTISDAVGDCAFGAGFAKATMISGQVTLAQDAYITIDVTGSVCGSIGTGWVLDITCDQSSSSRRIDPELIESIAKLESHLEEKENRLDILKLENVDELDFNIYPNPAKSLVSLQMQEKGLPYDLRVLDINGKVIVSDFNISDVTYTFNVSDFSSGMYMVDVRSKKKRYVKRLIVN